ncbi:MAG: hypothetical protein SGPRY_000366 [Prymnesium sp.]
MATSISDSGLVAATRGFSTEELNRLDFNDLMHGFSHVEHSPSLPDVQPTISTAQALGWEPKSEVDAFHAQMGGCAMDVRDETSLHEGHRILMQQWQQKVQEAQMKQQNKADSRCTLN